MVLSGGLLAVLALATVDEQLAVLALATVDELLAVLALATVWLQAKNIETTAG